jgi:hypothetical protein
MKTTLNLRDDIVRRAKARAALRGQPLARYIEEGIEQRLEKEEAQPVQLGAWLSTLPKVPEAAVKALDSILNAEDFREIDAEMWQ